jgi:hypothetical protein
VTFRREPESNSLLIYFQNGKERLQSHNFVPILQPLARVIATEETLNDLFATLDGERSRVLRNALIWNEDVEVYPQCWQC